MPVIIIDPGHGGEALGGNIDNRIERDIDLITAYAMKERLEQYEGVEVYLTREDNESKELTRKERFDFAKEKNGDYLFSIHYNMSESHTLYGTEVWICSQGPNYSSGMSFAKIEMEALTNLGLFDRGIKCKQDKKGGEYYGILKYSQEYNIPAVIIEHCHLDEERDSAFWNEESYKQFGITDADCVAKYFGLSSTSLGIDYSNYAKEEIEIPKSQVTPDLSGPDYCELTLLSYDDTTATCQINSIDSDTYVQYYSYSFDNGLTWSRLESWDDRNDESLTFTVELNPDKSVNMIVETFNKYDITTQSQPVNLPQAIIEIPTPEAEIEHEYEEIYMETQKPVVKESNPIPIILLSLVVLTSILVISFITSLIINIRRKKKRKQKKKHKQIKDEN